MEVPDINTLNETPAVGDPQPWHELRDVERQLAQLIVERPDATVREIAAELTRLEGVVADARGALEAAADDERGRRRDGRLERVVEALLPDDIPTAPAVWHAQRSAEARLELLREWGAWSAGELADRAGSTAGNRSALASSWRASGRALGVEWNGRTVYPAFQFAADGQPRPMIARVLAQLRRAGLSDWQTALWFTSATGWLDDRRPVDLLEDEPEAVEAAAAAFDERPT